MKFVPNRTLALNRIVLLSLIGVALVIMGGCSRFGGGESATANDGTVVSVPASDSETSSSAAEAAPDSTNPTTDQVAVTTVDEQAATTSSLPTATPPPTVAQESAPSPTPPVGMLTLWHSWAQRDADALESILQDFQSRYPGVKVETLFVAQDDLLQSYAQAVNNGSGPDVVLAPNWWLQDLHTVGAISPVDQPPFDAIAANVWPAALDNLRIEGRPYGIPTNYETVALYYNRALVSDGALPATLDELYSLASENPQQGIGLYANPFHIAWGFSAFGATLFDETNRAVFDQYPGTAAFLAWLADVDALNGSYVDSDYGMLLDRFKRGEYAFFVDGPWALEDLSAALGDDLGLTTIPAGPSGPARPWLYADAAYVKPNLAQPQAELVALLLDHFTAPSSSDLLASVARRLPAGSSVDLVQDPMLRSFASQALSAQGMDHGPLMDAFWRYGGDMLLRAVSGAEDLNTVVAETAALVNETTGN
jgi:arabinogalactan oligomer/maltooligosaccharide transport system substrate-binding protein